MSLADLADRHLGTDLAPRVALRWRGRDGRRRDFTFADLAAQSDILARHLARLGLTAGDKVAVMTGRQPETVIAALAIWKLGGIYCPLFNDLGPDPLRARLKVARPRLLLIDRTGFNAAVRPLDGALPSVERILFLGDRPPEDVIDLALLFRPDPDLPPLAAASGGGMLHFTSGTTGPVAASTGEPRAILHDQDSETRLVASAVQCLGIRAGDVLWCNGEPGWALHCAYGIVIPLALGATILLDQAPPTPAQCLAMLEEEHVDIWYTTPTVIRALMGAGAAAARSSRKRCLRLAASVGEPLSADAVEWGQRALGVPFRDTWWQTETAGVVLAHPLDRLPCAGSMGKPLPGLTVRLVDRQGDHLRFCRDEGEAVGEIALLSAHLASWRALGGEAGAPCEDIQGWHLTHDIARRDAAGNYWFLGRADDVINLSGRLVGPFEVEAVLLAHPAVAEVGVVGAPDSTCREHLVAFVGLHPGFDPIPALRDELHQFALEHLGSALTPEDIRFEAMLPRTSNGKILRRSLKSRLAGA